MTEELADKNDPRVALFRRLLADVREINAAVEKGALTLKRVEEFLDQLADLILMFDFGPEANMDLVMDTIFFSPQLRNHPKALRFLRQRVAEIMEAAEQRKERANEGF